jgi:hypothetical protein
LFNADGSSKYDFPDRELKPGEQIWVDVGKIIHDQVPDKNGKTLPANTVTGSYHIEDVAHPPIGHIFEGKLILDKTYGHVGYGCALCCAWSSSWQIADPLFLAPGTGNAQGLWAQNDCDSSQMDFTKYSYGWYSTNTSVATVDYEGSIDAYDVGEAYVYGFVDVTSGDGYYDPCPTQTDSPAADVVVPPEITGPTAVWFFGTGITQTGYATSITLTSSGGAVTTWSATNGGDSVSLSGSSGSTVDIQGLKKTTEGGVTIKATAGGISSYYTLTVLVPNRLEFSRYVNAPNASFGYQTVIHYQIIDNLGNVLPSAVDFNEHFTTTTAPGVNPPNVINDYSNPSVCPSGPVWTRGPEQPAPGASPTDIIDTIQGQALVACPTPVTPSSTYDSSTTQMSGGTKVHHFLGGFWVGSTTAGSGYPVQCHTWQRWLDHATHDSIQTPVTITGGNLNACP